MRRIVACLTLISLTSCATAPADTVTQSQVDASVPVCFSAADCNAKWEAAQLWVAKNAGMKIQTVTTVLIETFNTPMYGTELAMSVTKEPQGGGLYRIVAHANCANFFGCSTSPTKAVLAFNNAVIAATP